MKDMLAKILNSNELDYSKGILSIYSGFFSGGARNVHTDIVTQLQGRGIPQRVLCYYNKVDRGGKEGLHLMENDFNYKKLVSNGVRVDTLGISSPWKLMKLESDEIKLLAEYLLNDPAEVVLALKGRPVPALIEANQYIETVLGESPKPIIVSVHRTDPIIQSAGTISQLSMIENDPDRQKYIKGYIGHSNSAALVFKRVLNLEPHRVTGSPNGVDIETFSPQSEEAIKRGIGRYLPNAEIDTCSDVVIIAARNSPEKNIDLFISSAVNFLSENNEAHVVMCGSGMSVENIIPRFHQVLDMKVGVNEADKIINRVHPIGRVPRDDLAKLYSLAKVVSLTSPTLGEADPLVLKEGFAAGAVPVSTVCGDTPNTVGVRNPEEYYLRPLQESFVPGKYGVLTSLNAPDIAKAWQYAIDNYEAFRSRMKEQVSSLCELSMADRYLDAVNSIYEGRAKSVQR